MSYDIAVLDDNYRYAAEVHVSESINGLLFRTLVTPDEYPFLGLMKAEKEEDFIVPPEQVSELVAELDMLETRVRGEARMPDAVKDKCLDFVAQMKSACEAAKRLSKSVDFVAGE